MIVPGLFPSSAAPAASPSAPPPAPGRTRQGLAPGFGEHVNRLLGRREHELPLQDGEAGRSSLPAPRAWLNETDAAKADATSGDEAVLETGAVVFADVPVWTGQIPAVPAPRAVPDAAAGWSGEDPDRGLPSSPATSDGDWPRSRRERMPDASPRGKAVWGETVASRPAGVTPRPGGYLDTQASAADTQAPSADSQPSAAQLDGLTLHAESAAASGPETAREGREWSPVVRHRDFPHVRDDARPTRAASHVPDHARNDEWRMALHTRPSARPDAPVDANSLTPLPKPDAFATQPQATRPKTQALDLSWLRTRPGAPDRVGATPPFEGQPSSPDVSGADPLAATPESPVRPDGPAAGAAAVARLASSLAAGERQASNAVAPEVPARDAWTQPPVDGPLPERDRPAAALASAPIAAEAGDARGRHRDAVQARRDALRWVSHDIERHADDAAFPDATHTRPSGLAAAATFDGAGDVPGEAPRSVRQAPPAVSHMTTPAAFAQHASPAPARISSAASLAAPAPAADEAGLPDQIVQSLRLQVTSGGGEARVQLRPEYLGELTVRVAVDNGVVTARLEADVPAVREWIERHEGALRQALGEHGLSLDALIVTEGGESEEAAPRDSRHSREEPEQRQPRPRRRQPDDEHAPRFEVVV